MFQEKKKIIDLFFKKKKNQFMKMAAKTIILARE